MTMCALHCGDCLEVLPTLEANSVDTVITDPPYGLSDHKPQDVIDCLRAWLDGKPYSPDKKGFMGKSWDAWVPGPDVWRECLRVLKPGGMMLVFAGTRSMDLMSLSIRLAGFELRDGIGYAHDTGGAPLLAWVHGQGFPKSLDISKAIDKAAGAEREIIGRKTGRAATPVSDMRGGRMHAGGTTAGAFDASAITAPATPAAPAAQAWHGWGTALKPAWEPIILAMKPLDGTFAQNAQRWGVAGLNVEGGRIPITDGATMARNNKPGANGWKNSSGGPNTAALNGEPAGRWPANVLLDEESAAALDAQSGVLKPGGSRANTQRGQVFYHGGAHTQYDNGGGASRFFYVAKASRAERNAGLDGMEARYQLRNDLTPEQRAYVMGELQRLGIA